MQFFSANEGYFKNIRHDIGGHFGMSAAIYAVEKFRSGDTGSIEQITETDLTGTGRVRIQLKFAHEIATAATFRHLRGTASQDQAEQFIELAREGFSKVTKAVDTLITHHLGRRFGQ